MIRINLIGRLGSGASAVPPRQPGDSWDKAATAVAVAALVVAAALIVSETWSILRMAREVSGALAAAHADRQEQAAAVERLAAAEERRALLARQVAELSRWQETRSAPSRMLDAVSRSLPKGLWLTDLRQETDALVLVGRTTRPAGVFEFAGNLESSGRIVLPVEVMSVDALEADRFEIRVAASVAEQ